MSTELGYSSVSRPIESASWTQHRGRRPSRECAPRRRSNGVLTPEACGPASWRWSCTMQCGKFGQGDLPCFCARYSEGAQDEFGCGRACFSPTLVAFEDHPYGSDGGAHEQRGNTELRNIGDVEATSRYAGRDVLHGWTRE